MLQRLTCLVWFAGLDTDGIYRVSGNLAVIQKLRFLVNHGENDVEEDEPQCQSVAIK